ncbi:unnamed protein product, partial [marine sediment metagenome]
MYSTKISVSYKETMGSRSKSLIIALITFASLAFIFVVILLGISGAGGQNIYFKSGIQPLNAGAALNLDNDNTEPIFSISLVDENDVLVPEKCQDLDIDTETGFIKVLDYNVPRTLPLCLKDENIAGWSITFFSYG